MPTDLVNFWRRFKPSEPHYAHPDDLEIFRSSGGKYVLADSMGFGDFISSPRFGDFQDHRLHLSLLPAPYCGDLTRADVVILLLNPGLGYRACAPPLSVVS
ncbi:MAG: hypothetical protein WD673_17145 [Alphaproteobacteria bacterium]